MAINKNRNRKPKTETAEFDDFVAQGGTVADDAPAPKKRQAAAKRASTPTAPAWVERAETAKKTEAQPFRYNMDQQEDNVFLPALRVCHPSTVVAPAR